MKKILDENGKEIPGIFKDRLGSIVINDDRAYKKYLAELNKVDEIRNLKEEILQLKKQMKTVLEHMNG